MSGKIKMTHEAMAKSSSFIKTKYTEFESILRTLDSAISSLESKWEGAARLSFIREYSTIRPEMSKYPQILSKLSAQLAEASKELEAADSKSAALTKSTQGNSTGKTSDKNSNDGFHDVLGAFLATDKSNLGNFKKMKKINDTIEKYNKEIKTVKIKKAEINGKNYLFVKGKYTDRGRYGYEGKFLTDSEVRNLKTEGYNDFKNVGDDFKRSKIMDYDAALESYNNGVKAGDLGAFSDFHPSAVFEKNIANSVEKFKNIKSIDAGLLDWAAIALDVGIDVNKDWGRGDYMLADGATDAAFDLGGVGVGMVAGAAGTAATAAIMGATVGSAVPVVGTVVGAAAGLVAGLIYSEVTSNAKIIDGKSIKDYVKSEAREFNADVYNEYQKGEAEVSEAVSSGIKDISNVANNVGSGVIGFAKSIF